MSKISVSRETFENYDTEGKLNTLFDCICSINDNQCEQVDKCEPRIKALENRRFKDKGFAGLMGLMGGFAAGLVKKIV